MPYSATIDVPNVDLASEIWLGNAYEVTLWVALARGRRPSTERVRALMRRYPSGWRNVERLEWKPRIFPYRVDGGLVYRCQHGGEVAVHVPGNRELARVHWVAAEGMQITDDCMP